MGCYTSKCEKKSKSLHPSGHAIAGIPLVPDILTVAGLPAIAIFGLDVINNSRKSISGDTVTVLTKGKHIIDEGKHSTDEWKHSTDGGKHSTGEGKNNTDEGKHSTSTNKGKHSTDEDKHSTDEKGKHSIEEGKHSVAKENIVLKKFMN